MPLTITKKGKEKPEYDFDNLVFGKPSAKGTDPETSHWAAEDAAVGASEGRLFVLLALRENGPLTDYGLERETGKQKNSIGKRRLDCERAGLVSKFTKGGIHHHWPDGPTGSKCLVYCITEMGLAYLTYKGH